MDRDFTDVTNAENDLNPAAAGEFRSLCTQLFNYEKILKKLFSISQNSFRVTTMLYKCINDYADYLWEKLKNLLYFN